ncbi:alpha amylase [Dichomitus squalens LYAD-421 SS1]|uniref:alpha amylase n=1 Tax=Dichomitus squalens (strain LYAD-421) TaxID=732165 RepID=UPI0004410E90|nr:alpha amylase [Dichomitus squalens LYAD-421 SS1]EJF64974.1 alpha amylase [Dichomitus squalens LYAD-421 SS1]
MFLGALSDTLIRVWEYVTFWWYYPPALSNMRLKGPARAGDDNALMVQFFTWEANNPEMSWWKHFETEVPNLAAMGVTQVWLPPPNKAMRKQGQGYDAYDLWDLGEFYQKGTIATRWGTKEELVRAVAAANAHGIDVLVDAVLNHKLGGDRPEKFMATPVDPNNRLMEIGPTREIEGWTAFDFHGRAEKYSSLKWTYEHFTGLDWDHKTRTKGVWRISSDKHKGWSEWVDRENGNYDYLLGIDIDHRHPEVRKDLMTWGSWVLQTTGGAGFRLDAIKHMDRRFLLSFIKHVRETLGRQDLFSVAEYWSTDLEAIKPYIRVFEGLVTFFDVPLHYNFHEASKVGSKYDLRKIFDNSIMTFRPGDAVTFVDNHDTQIGQTLESWVGVNFKLQAYALILLYGEGHPCVFYGDLYPNEECYDSSIAQGRKRLMEIRKKFAYGARSDYFAHKNCIGFVRKGKPGSGSGHGGCAVLISNADVPEQHGRYGAVLSHTIRMNVGSENAGAKYREYYSPSNPEKVVQIDAGGWGAFSCPPGDLQVWVRRDTPTDDDQ